MRKSVRNAQAPIVAVVLLAIAATIASTLATAEDSCPAPTPTSTASGSPQPSPTQTGTGSPEPSPTATSTGSPEPSPTSTGTQSGSPSSSPTPTATGTPTSTDTPTPTPNETSPSPEPTESTSGPILTLPPIPSGGPSGVPSLSLPPLTNRPSESETPAALQPGRRNGNGGQNMDETPPPGADPCREGVLTIAVNPSVGVVGTSFRVSGRLTCAGSPVANAVVIVSRLTGDPTDFQPSQARTTNSDGRYSTIDHPNAAAEYQATWSGSDACGRGARSALVHAAVRPGIVLNQSHTVLPIGEEVEFTGTVQPGHPNAFVILQIFRGNSGEWDDVAWLRLNEQSAYRFVYAKTGSRGYLVFRIGFPTQDGDHTWNISRRVRVDWN